jgi:Cu/Ag efflux protein CusF
VVRGVDAARGEITIDHGEIPGLMAAMTMSFAVDDPALLEGVAVGTEVDFRVREEGGRYTVTELAPASGGRATP